MILDSKNIFPCSFCFYLDAQLQYSKHKKNRKNLGIEIQIEL